MVGQVRGEIAHRSTGCLMGVLHSVLRCIRAELKVHTSPPSTRMPSVLVDWSLLERAQRHLGFSPRCAGMLAPHSTVDPLTQTL